MEFINEIASYLEIETSQITKVTELYYVWCVCVAGKRPCFVSKKKVKQAAKRLYKNLAKAAFLKVQDECFWKAEYSAFIYALVGSNVSAKDSLRYWERFEPINQMIEIGIKDRAIASIIDAANLLTA